MSSHRVHEQSSRRFGVFARMGLIWLGSGIVSDLAGSLVGSTLLCDPAWVFKAGRFLEQAVWGIAGIAFALGVGALVSSVIVLVTKNRVKAIRASTIGAILYFLIIFAGSIVFGMNYLGRGCNAYP
jgi:hypothetical protein